MINLENRIIRANTETKPSYYGATPCAQTMTHREPVVPFIKEEIVADPDPARPGWCFLLRPGMAYAGWLSSRGRVPHCPYRNNKTSEV